MSRRFNPTVWCMTTNSITDYIILVIDRQKPWERVVDYLMRVIALFRSRKMSARRDGRLMYRMFLGGLREDIQDRMMWMGPRLSMIRAAQRAMQYERILNANPSRDAVEDTEDDDEFMYADLEDENGDETNTLGEDVEVAPGVLFGKNVVALNGFVGEVGQDVAAGTSVGACELADGDVSMNEANGEDVGQDGVDGMDNGMGEDNDGSVDDDEAGLEDEAVGGAPADFDPPAHPEEPYIVQNGQEFFGKPNKIVDQLFNARYILILYR